MRQRAGHASHHVRSRSNFTPSEATGPPGEFMAVSWDEALDDIATELHAIISQHGGEALATYVGTATSFATLHGMYAVLFMRALGGSKLYSPMQWTSRQNASRAKPSTAILRPIPFPISSAGIFS